MRLGNVTILVIDREVTGQDDYGNDVLGAVETEVPGCAVAPRTTSENNDGRSQVITGLELYAPGTPIKASSAVRIGQETYEVEGTPGLWATAGFTAQEVALKQVAG